MQISPMGAKLLHTDRQANTTKLTVAFRNFANAPENEGECMIQATKYHIWKICVPHTRLRYSNVAEMKRKHKILNLENISQAYGFRAGLPPENRSFFQRKVTRSDP
jgi:hypothetical protein